MKLFDIAREIEVKRRAIEYRDLHERDAMVKRMLSEKERKSKRKEQKQKQKQHHKDQQQNSTLCVDESLAIAPRRTLFKKRADPS